MSDTINSQTQKSIRFIVNPISGTQSDDIEDFLQRALQHHRDWSWQLCPTEGEGDARRLAKEAADQGLDIAVACGGDGTVMEVADGLSGSRTALAILPTGTANVMSVELGIPANLEQALALALDAQAPIRSIDMGKMQDQSFILRVSLGFEADYSVEAARGEKSQKGRWAYVQSAWRALGRLRRIRYTINVDGQYVVAHGNGCMVCNSSSVGFPGLKITAATSVSDGLLDVIVLPELKSPAVTRVFASMFQSVIPVLRDQDPPVNHWQGRHIVVESNHHQMICCDGEPVRQARQVEVAVMPKAIRVKVPPETASLWNNS